MDFALLPPEVNSGRMYGSIPCTRPASTPTSRRRRSRWPRSPGCALPSVEFLRGQRAPNVLQIGQKYGQFQDYAEIVVLPCCSLSLR